jgi:hypothetical protein
VSVISILACDLYALSNDEGQARVEVDVPRVVKG